MDGGGFLVGLFGRGALFGEREWFGPTGVCDGGASERRDDDDDGGDGGEARLEPPAPLASCSPASGPTVYLADPRTHRRLRLVVARPAAPATDVGALGSEPIRKFASPLFGRARARLSLCGAPSTTGAT